MKLVESNELLSKDLLDFIESYKVRRIHILFHKYTLVNMHKITLSMLILPFCTSF